MTINYLIIFVTGLTVGGLTCLAVQGGLLASVVAAQKGDANTKSWYATGAFLVSKLIAYTLLGFILGAFGGALNINENVQTVMQLLAGIYMILVALNLLNVHPLLRYVVIQPPRFLARLVKNQSRSKDIFAPALLGAMTIFIPCGTTLAMETLAISSASAVQGALIMALFVLGTVPLFLGIGIVTSKLGESLKTRFFKFAAIPVLVLGIMSVNGALVALGSPLTFQSIGEKLASSGKPKNVLGDSAEVTQNAVINIVAHGYSPNYIKVKKGSPVTLKLVSKGVQSCALAFRIPSLGLSKNLRPNDSQEITFTPTSIGKIPFTCSMGMYTGVIEVI